MLAALCVALALSIAAPTLLAQWPRVQNPKIPRTADGQPILTAPAPRTADGKPDLSGVWAYAREARPRVDVGIGGAGGTPLSDGVTVPNLLLQFWDIGYGMKDPLPLQPWARELRNKRTADNNKDNPDAHCLPLGPMQLHTHPEPRKMIQTPDLLLVLYEANDGVRQIFLDGRPLPTTDPNPTWYGYSTGRWEGDTLVVQTSGLRDGGWLDVIGTPFTDAVKFTERYRRVNVGNMEIEVTVDDPKAYTQPWTVLVKQRLMADTELIEFVCLENEKSSRHFQ